MQIRDVLPRDAIPSIDTPQYGADYFGSDDDEVLVAEGTPPRAYPLRILSYHEVVNADGVAVTWCPICGSAVVYDAMVDGESLTFGVSGKLADDGLVLYDRQTDSEWHQPTGRCLAGPHEGRQLTARPARLLTYGRFRAAYPNGEVLQPARSGDPAVVYDMDPYEAYFARDAFGLHGMRGEGEPQTWDRDDLAPKDVVLDVGSDADAVAFPRQRVAAAGGLVRETVAGQALLIVLGDGELHAYEAPGFPIERADGNAPLSGDGTTWDPATGHSDDGRQLTPAPARRLFAFAWQDAHGADAFWRDM
ncbi:DUF3179 domain-containing (seleno)protein [Halosegnis sp.]|uniref:DUF3179 domain-containing (seleno)protein n=1 Tax=Halosegnis sp. TaxID=2864959 RepID=UPI0035D433AA